MAAALSSADMPLPPGFESYDAPPVAPGAGGADRFDEADLEDLRAFMAGGSGAAGPPRAEPEGPPAARIPQPAMRTTAQELQVTEAHATVQIESWSGPADTTSRGRDAATAADEASKILDMDARFEDLGLCEGLLRGIYDMGFVKPSKIQTAALPLIAWRPDRGLGENMIGQAQNGSGKTATFSLALLSALDMSLLQPQAMVICPTRELARQNEVVISQLGKFLQVQTCLVCPGPDRVPKNPKCHVLVGTPGKFTDLVKKYILDVSAIKVFVLDEADVMLDQDNMMGPQVTQVRKWLPADLQVLFFSATYPDTVREFAEKIVPKAFNIKVRKTDLTVSSVAQMYVQCESEEDKFQKLSNLYGAMNVGQSVIFVNQRRTAFGLAQGMRDAGHTVSLICGTVRDGKEQMDPELRDRVMHEFRSGVTRVLIATDVLARGIDVPQVTLVVNYELPLHYGDRNAVNMETYVHRIGRTGRFGLCGIAINLVLPSQRHLVEDVKSFFACEIPEAEGDFEMIEERLKMLR